MECLIEYQINDINFWLALTEIRLSECYSILGNIDMAADHYILAISNARRIDKEEVKIVLIRDALIKKGQNLRSKSKDSEALAVFGEAEKEVAEAYDPDHPIAKQTSLFRAEIICEIEELKRAESLTNNTDALMSSKEISDRMAAENLARETLHHRKRIWGSNHYLTCPHRIILSNILQEKKNHDGETRVLLERCLAIYLKFESSYIFHSASAVKNHNYHHWVSKVNDSLAKVHRSIAKKLHSGDTRREQCSIAVNYSKEAIRISTKRYGPDYPQTIEYESNLSS
jgi:hypothetical protein